MVAKTIFMITLFFMPLVILSSGLVDAPVVLFLLYVISGLGMAGIGMSVMHDAIHGSYSKNKKINTFLGYSFNLIGGSAVIWKIQHNILHHTYTNIDEADDDLNAPFFSQIFSTCKALLGASVSTHIHLVFLFYFNNIMDNL